MANVINMGGSGANIESKTVKSSQTQQTITPPDGIDGFNPVIVSPFVLQSKTVSPSTSQQTVKPDTGMDGLSQVTVNAMKLQSKSVSPSTSQQIIKADSSYNGLSQVTVNAASLQSKIVSPKSSIQYIYPDSGYYGLSSVTVNSLEYTSTTANLQQTMSGLTLTFPSSIMGAVAIVATGICLADFGTGQVQLPYVVTYYADHFGRISVPLGNFVTNYSISGTILSGYFVGSTLPVYGMVSNTLDAFVLG